MRALALILTTLALVPFAARAQMGPTGLNGYIVNVDSHRPIAGASVEIYKIPVVNLTDPVHILHTNSSGYFSTIQLAPGRYIIMASALDAHAGCEISDLYEGVMTRVRIEISRSGEHCVGKNVGNATVVPGQGNSVYIVH